MITHNIDQYMVVRYSIWQIIILLIETPNLAKHIDKRIQP